MTEEKEKCDVARILCVVLMCVVATVSCPYIWSLPELFMSVPEAVLKYWSGGFKDDDMFTFRSEWDAFLDYIDLECMIIGMVMLLVLLMIAFGPSLLTSFGCAHIAIMYGRGAWFLIQDDDEDFPYVLLLPCVLGGAIMAAVLTFIFLRRGIYAIKMKRVEKDMQMEKCVNEHALSQACA